MLSPATRRALESAITQATGRAFRLKNVAPVPGGCISQNLRVEDEHARFFVKMGAGAGKQFAAEADGLAALAQCRALRVPEMITLGQAPDADFLVLEWLDLAEEGSDARLGEALAALHTLRYPRYGWAQDNFLGRSLQQNAWDDHWPRFYAERRLRPQLDAAAAKGAPWLKDEAEPLLAGLDRHFVGANAPAALLHGDLWSGNRGFVAGQPALFDPAVHAGDPECDLAMAALFGGFSADFYAAHAAAHPPRPGWAERRALYQLYHVLNHFNLFGGGYGREALSMIRRLCAALA